MEQRQEAEEDSDDELVGELDHQLASSRYVTHTLPGKAGNKGGSSNLNYRKPNKTPAQERASKRNAADYQEGRQGRPSTVTIVVS